MKYQRKHSILIKKKHLKIIAPILVAIIIIVVIVSTTTVSRERSDKQKAIDNIAEIGIINVGLRADLGAICSFNSETDMFEGLDKDIADEVIDRLFGDDILVNYYTVTSETKDALIRIGDLDLALGAALNKEMSGICYSNPYYTDGSAFLVIEGTMVSQDGLDGKTIGIVQGSLPADESEKDEDITKMQAYLDANSIDAQVKLFASYPEAVEALKAGFVDGVCASEIFLKMHGKKGMLILPERFLPHRFCVEASTGLGAFCSVVSDTISEMREDGTLDALYDKWKLIDYAALED